jgi:protein required for attachment to host cells
MEENLMLEDGSTWFLVADGRRARVLVEARRGANLQEDWSMEIGPDELYDTQDRPPRTHDSVGAGRHAMDKGRNLHEAEEEKFLKRVAERLTDAYKKRQFHHLAIAAPPRALGVLRGALPESVQARVRAEASKDLLDEDESTLRARLRDMLRH